MNAPVNRLAGLAPAILILFALGLVIGCEQLESDTVRADRRVAGFLEDAEQARRTEAEVPSEARLAALRQAAGETAASPDRLAHARSLLGQSQLESAQRLMRQIERDELEANRLMFDIDRFVRQIAISSTVVEGHRLAEPSASRQEIERLIAQAQGGADQQAWISHEQAELPTLSAVKQRISQLEGEITRRQERIAQLQGQRRQLIPQAEQADQQARATERDESVAAFTRASNLRKQATDVLIEIEGVEAEVRPLEMELAKARDQQSAIERAIAAMQERLREVDQSWSEAQRQIQAQQNLARGIAEGQGDREAEVSLAAKARALGEVVARLEQARTEAAGLLEEAIGNFLSAGTSGDQAVRTASQRQADLQDRRDRSDFQAWEHQRLANNPLTFYFRQAHAMHLLATLYSGAAVDLHGRLELSRSAVPVLRAANLQIPAPLEEGELEARLSEALEAADQAYEAAIERLDTIRQGTMVAQVPQLREQARAAQAVVSYGWGQLARRQGDEPLADRRIQRAIGDLRELRADPQIRPLLPTLLPPELAAVLAPQPAPAPQPPQAVPEDEES